MMIAQLKTFLTKKILSISTIVLAGLIMSPLSFAQDTALTDAQKINHFLNRFGFGPSPGQFAYVQKVGLPTYINEQMNAPSRSFPEALAREVEALPSRQTTPAQYYNWLKQENQIILSSPDPKAAENALLKKIYDLRRQFWVTDSQVRLIRAVNNPFQLQEVMTDFWFNHFNVSYGRDIMLLWIGRYEDNAIRPYALGKFADLLIATSKHPAMMYYLDNWLNTSPGSPGAKGMYKGLNENYARELLELHTLGVNGGYNQTDVTELARVLTGWGLASSTPLTGLRTGQGFINDITQQFYFDATRHDNTPKTVLGTTINPGGAQEVENVLRMLARHPATAERISAKLAEYFVSDTPPAALVGRMKQKYLETDGDIKSVMAVLLNSPELWSQASYQAKFKNPFRYYISALRIYGLHPMQNPQYMMDTLRNSGMPLYTCVAPTGYKNTAGAWLSPDALTQRISFAMSYTLRRLPIKPADTITDQMLISNWGGPLSPGLISALGHAEPQQRSGFFIGSPNFMKY